MALNQPSFIPEPWASQGSRTAIPDTTSESGRASWAQGFPPETALPLGSGGVPPHWLDFQGVLHALSNHAVFKQSGGRFAWSASLDYPVGACIIGSDSKVYQALQNSGPGYSAGAKNPATAGNSAYWGSLATPDGTSIVVNGSGKLAVSATDLASKLADGTTITASNGKLSAVGGDAASLADGQTIVASGGKLKVNYGAGLEYDSQTGKLIVVFNDLTVDQIEALCDPDGGIAAGANGLYVDFDTMPTDKFEALLKSLKMQIPLSTNMTVYVAVNDPAASDTIEDGRGTEALPFKTIQAAVNFITQNYALGPWTVTIRVKAGTYSISSALTLPSFTATVGFINITADDPAQRPSIVNASSVQSLVAQRGGTWHLTSLDFIDSVSPNDSALPQYPSGIGVDGGTCYLQNVGVTISYSGAAPAAFIQIRALVASGGGQLIVNPNENGPTSIEMHVGNASNGTMITVGADSQFLLRASNLSPQNDCYKLYMSGETSAVVAVPGGRFTWSGGEQNRIVMAVPSGETLTGVAYAITAGGSMYMKSDSPVPGPDVTTGTVESASYSWYAVNPNI